MIRPIVLFPEAVLLKACEPVTVFDDELVQLGEDLKDTLDYCPGYGLAAPQIGVGKRVILLDVPPDKPMVLVNPTWTPVEGAAKERAIEGCLSVPDVQVGLDRYNKIVLSALTVNREPVTYSFEGMIARAAQHECDHLEGVLLWDNIGKVKRSLLITKFQKSKRDIRRQVRRGLREAVYA